MNIDFLFVVNSLALGAGLAMDAFSVSLANGLNEPGMRRRKICIIAGTFAFFQALMPMIGWVCVHTIVQYFRSFEKWIPWIALILLLFIGGKMLIEGIRHKDGDEEKPKVGDEVVLFGAQKARGQHSEIPVDEISDMLDTINYEVTCLVGKRIPRVYIQDGKIVQMHSSIW